MVEIGGEIGGQVIRHAVKFLESVQKRGRLLSTGSMRTIVPDFHGTFSGSLITPFSMTAVMRMAALYTGNSSASIRVHPRNPRTVIAGEGLLKS